MAIVEIQKTPKEQIEEAAAANAKEHPGKRKKCGSVSYNAFIAGALFGAKLGFEAAKESAPCPIPGACAYYFKFDKLADFMETLK